LVSAAPAGRCCAGSPAVTTPFGEEIMPSMPDRRAIEAALRHLVPRIPKHEFEAVVDHALDSDGLRSAEAGTAAWLSLTAYVRHTFTDYDKLLAEGYDRESARHFVVDATAEKLAEWGSRRPFGENDV